MPVSHFNSRNIVFLLINGHQCGTRQKERKGHAHQVQKTSTMVSTDSQAKVRVPESVYIQTVAELMLVNEQASSSLGRGCRKEGRMGARSEGEKMRVTIKEKVLRTYGIVGCPSNSHVTSCH